MIEFGMVLLRLRVESVTTDDELTVDNELHGKEKDRGGRTHRFATKYGRERESPSAVRSG
jgi:hypothetical protein